MRVRLALRQGSPRCGNSLTPVSGRLRRAISASRFATVSSIRAVNDPSARAASIPPASSIRPSSSHPAAARSSVSFSTAYAPPAGSETRARWDSEISSEDVFRAIRRPRASGTPRTLSNGSTVTESAPPTPAANAATVVRSMFTHGSYLLIIGRLVTAC